MRASTLSLIAKVKEAKLFARVGMRDEIDVDYASSWGEAIALCSSDDWETLQSDGSNAIRNKLHKDHRDRYREWNFIVADLKEELIPLVDAACHPIMVAHALPQVFLDSVRWDVLGAGIEAEYSDVATPGMFTSLMSFYLRGHFPCGWRASSTRSTFVIY